MQDETSIPEDIIDQQHLQEIIDKQQGIQKKTKATRGDGSGDIIDVNLPYDDSDTDAEVDIILESQRSSERSDYNKTNNNSNVADDDDVVADDEDEHEVDKNKNNNSSNLKKTNNKKEILKEKKILKTNYNTDNSNNNNGNIYNKNKENKQQQQQHQQKKIKSENNIDYSNQYNIYDAEEQHNLEDGNKSNDDGDEKEEVEKFEQDVWDDVGDDDDDDDDDGSAEYEKFKTMHEQKQKEQQQRLLREQQREQQQHNEQQQPEQQKEQISSIKKLNERKFNNNPPPDLNEKLVNTIQRDNSDGNPNVDNNSNDDISSSYAYDNNNNNKNDDYDIFHKYQQQKIQQQQQEHQQQQQQQQPKEDAIGDIEENENQNQNVLKTTITTSNTNNEESKDFTKIFIPRKMKRHNGAARLDDATSRYTRLKHQQQLQKSQIDNFDTYDDNNDDTAAADVENFHKENIAKISSQEENFKKKYYDILKENSTQSHYHHPSSGDATSSKDFNFNDQDNDKETTTTYEAKKQTAFEKEKSLRRNNKHYGHKTHKKKYKDYLRFSQIMMMTTTTTTPSTPSLATPSTTMTTKTSQQSQVSLRTAIKGNSKKSNQNEGGDLNTLRDKHLEKLKIEKLKSLIPQAPIFLLKPKEEKQEEVKEVLAREDSTGKPFYEGQINYFMETDDNDDNERADAVRFITKGERMDTNDWFKKLSPVLRNGNKKSTAPPKEQRGFAAVRAGYTPYHHYKHPQPPARQHHLHQQPRNHQYHHQHQQHHQQHHQQQHHHQQPHHRQVGRQHSRHHAYQRKMIPKQIMITTTPLPPPSRQHLENGDAIRELGHQITDLKDFERYYAKWPHLAKVQSQLHEEELREQQAENYPDYEYDSDDYWEENNDNKDDNLPPYIRKYNRRNKQLLDLLEGTLAPPTKPVQQLRWSGSKLQPGPRDSSVGSMSVHIDDEYLKEKRKRYHQRQRQIHDLFAQQRTSTTTQQPPPYPYVKGNGKEVTDDSKGTQNSHTDNHLPDEDVSISLESNEQDHDYGNSKHAQEHHHGDDADASNDGDDDDVSKSVNEREIWQKEIDTKSANTGNSPITWQMEKLIASTPSASAASSQQQGVGLTSTSTQKPAIFKLPSYPSIAGSFMNRPRSRSAQFAPSSGSEYRRVTMPYLPSNLNNNNMNMNSNFINAGGFVAYNGAATNGKSITARFSQNTPTDYNKQQSQQQQQPSALVAVSTTIKPSSSESSSRISNFNHLTPPSSVTNSFIYHRVVDASPRLVGAGLLAGVGGRKQRLPFVAITDRRLETSKKSLTDHQKDFEQNHYPLP